MGVVWGGGVGCREALQEVIHQAIVHLEREHAGDLQRPTLTPAILRKER